MRDAEVVQTGLAACRTELDRTGLLLVQDARLPCVTTLVAGEVVRGSWWGHEQAHSIFDVLNLLEDDAARVKLLAKKVTMAHRRLWPALIAVGRTRAAWQTDGLADDARAVLDVIDRADGVRRADALEVESSRKPSAIVNDLEHRLLVHTDEVHTESGRHVKVLQTWDAWATDVGVRDVPTAAEGITALTDAARLVADSAGRSLPWPNSHG